VKGREQKGNSKSRFSSTSSSKIDRCGSNQHQNDHITHIVGYIHQRKCVICPSVCPPHTSHTFRSFLDVTRDSSMTFDTQLTATAVRACNFHLQFLRQLRSSLPRDVAQSVACAIIGSRLDYCNSLYYGMSTTKY